MGAAALLAGLLGGSDAGGGGAAGDPKLTVSLSPQNRSGGGAAGGHVGNMSAIAGGGNGVFAYAWSVFRADPDYALTINSPAAATTTFDFDAVAPADTAQATVRCTVSSNGQVAHADGLVTFVNSQSSTGGGGGGTLPGFGDPPQ